jgi:hypothetical protein
MLNDPLFSSGIPAGAMDASPLETAVRALFFGFVTALVWYALARRHGLDGRRCLLAFPFPAVAARAVLPLEWVLPLHGLHAKGPIFGLEQSALEGLSAWGVLFTLTGSLLGCLVGLAADRLRYQWTVPVTSEARNSDAALSVVLITLLSLGAMNVLAYQRVLNDFALLFDCGGRCSWGYFPIFQAESAPRFVQVLGRLSDVWGPLFFKRALVVPAVMFGGIVIVVLLWKKPVWQRRLEVALLLASACAILVGVSVIYRESSALWVPDQRNHEKRDAVTIALILVSALSTLTLLGLALARRRSLPALSIWLLGALSSGIALRFALENATSMDRLWRNQDFVLARLLPERWGFAAAGISLSLVLWNGRPRLLWPSVPWRKLLLVALFAAVAGLLARSRAFVADARLFLKHEHGAHSALDRVQACGAVDLGDPTLDQLAAPLDTSVHANRQALIRAAENRRNVALLVQRVEPLETKTFGTLERGVEMCALGVIRTTLEKGGRSIDPAWTLRKLYEVAGQEPINPLLSSDDLR